MNKKGTETSQLKYEELGHKIQDFNYEQTKLMNDKFQTTTFQNNHFEENLRIPQNNLNISMMEEENQVVSILKNLRLRHTDIENILAQKENEKNAIMEDINILTQRMKMLDKSIVKKKTVYESYEKTLKDAENAFLKISESTKTLLSVIKKENFNLAKITGTK